MPRLLSDLKSALSVGERNALPTARLEFNSSQVGSGDGTSQPSAVKNDMKLKILENGNCLLGGKKDNVEIRVVNFCSLDNKVEYRLATNLSKSEFSDSEIGEIYRKRWAIETLWKFLKMHLKLDKLITKNDNGIQIQIYSCLIGYLILQLTEIPEEIGNQALDKLRYLQPAR